jgi:hypothetical protein
MIDLLKELDGFRKGKNFKRFGFSVGGENNSWIKNIEKLSQSTDNHTHECASLLANIGYKYAISKGMDNDSIKDLRLHLDDKILQNV